MSFKLIDRDWHSVIRKVGRANRSSLRIVCPFIKREVVRELLDAIRPEKVQVITRFNMADFYGRVSDLSALRVLLEHGAKVRGVRGLHTKLFLFVHSAALVTSANLTKAAMRDNHELGFLATDEGVVGSCGRYFRKLWNRAGNDLTSDRLDVWERSLDHTWANPGNRVQVLGLKDYGHAAGDEEGPVLAPRRIAAIPDRVASAEQALVKFFGSSKDRAPRDYDMLESVRHSGCHWACTYPKNRRPRKVKQGAVMFMARFADDPKDILVFGRAMAEPYIEGRDDASDEDLEKRPWKVRWPHYIRVDHPEFVAGTLGNGVSLNRLMAELKSDAFATTQYNAKMGEGNTNPRHAYMRMPDVELSEEGQDWLNTELQLAFERYGTLTPVQMATLDWPAVKRGR